MMKKETLGILTPAMRLLLICCSNEMPARQKERAREMISEFTDWDQLLRLAVENRVCPTLYKNLCQMDGAAINPEFLRSLQNRCAKIQMNAVKLAAELLRISAIFEEKGVRALSVKGPALGMMIYGDVSLRTSKDLDILVNREDLEAAEAALLMAGYGKDAATAALTPRQREYCLKHFYDFSYVNKDHILVELHWRYDAAYLRYQFENLWENRKTLSLFGKSVPVLSQEDNFLYLAFHGSKHAWKRLRWLCDVNEIVLGGGLDWAYIVAEAKRCKTACMVEQTLALLELLFETKPPENLFGLDIARHASIRLAERALPLLLSVDKLNEYPGHPCFLAWKKYLLAWNSGPRRKTQCVVSHFRPGPLEFQAIRIRDPFFFLYFIARLLLKVKRMLGGKKAGQFHESSD